MDISRQSQHITRTAQQDAPKKAPILSRQETLLEQYTIINNWKPQRDVESRNQALRILLLSITMTLGKTLSSRWPLTFGRGILIGAAMWTGIYINTRFRAKLKLRDHGTVPTLLGLSLAPATATALSHTQFILNKLLLLEIPCPLCIETRSVLVQTCSGLLLPLALAPIANFSVVVGTGAYNVPHITDVRGIFRTVMSVYQPLIPKIALIFTFHALLAGFITYLEIKSFLRVLDMQYLMKEEKERKLENDII